MPDSQIGWPVIDQHRQKSGASFAAVVAEGFSGGQLHKFADQFKVTLIATDTLCALLALHARTPFTLIELRELFAAPGLADASVQMLKARHQQHLRHWRLVGEIVETMDRFQRQMPSGFTPTVDQLHHVLLGQSGGAVVAVPSQQDVADAVAFLASRATNVLTEVPGAARTYQLTMSAETAGMRVRALARGMQVPPGLAQAVSGSAVEC